MGEKILLIILSILTQVAASAQGNMSRITTNFDNNWKFALGDYPNANKPVFNDNSWRTLNLPHDWSVEGKNAQENPGGGADGFFPMGIGWYRKVFDIPTYSKDKLYSIEFDGVYMNSTVWINGNFIGTRPYGYASFYYDLTPYLKAKDNVIAVKVDNSLQPNARWYTGSGIYRHVRLVENNKVSFEKWGIYNYTENIENGKARVAVEFEVVNKGTEAARTLYKGVIIDPRGKEVGSSEMNFSISPGTSQKNKIHINVSNPQLWTLESPVLYKIVSTMSVNGVEVDRFETSAGIRTIVYDVNKGCLLNGQQVKLKGVNCRHDGGAVGVAVPERVWERRFEILKSSGCNAIRTCHSSPAPEYLDLCDKFGFLVMEEAFDEWATPKADDNHYAYHYFFDKWYKEDLLAMVKRDRNHPSVAMWSLGNEVPDQETLRGPELAREMITLVHLYDRTRKIVTGNDMIAADANAATEEFLKEFDDEIIGYNYPDRWHERAQIYWTKDKEAHPNRRFLSTESSGVGGGARGSYNLGNDPNKITATYASSRFLSWEQRWKFLSSNDYAIGDFQWISFDHYGETRWPSRGAQAGFIDNCGFVKDGYYLLKSVWTDEPVLHLMPHWNWSGREGQVIPVICFTNCGEVELFVNGKSYGVKRLEFPVKGHSGSWTNWEDGKIQPTTGDLHLSWDVIYEPGEIVAIGKKDGKEYTEKIVTTGNPAKIRLTVDRESFRAQASDVANITVDILDKDNNIVPTAGNLVKFEVVGARIIGVENGDMRDFGSTKIPERSAFNGKCLAIVQADKPGKITFKATSEGLEPCEISFQAK
jgi:beta-galactosidase